MNTIIELRESIKSGLERGESLESLQPLLLQYIGNDWTEHVKVNPKLPYTRNRVTYTDDFDILVLCWQPNKQSPPHDHPDNGCILKVLKGKLIERLFKSTDSGYEKLSDTVMDASMTSYIEKKDVIHQISNPTNDVSVSLHVYSPPFYCPKTYCVENYCVCKCNK